MKDRVFQLCDVVRETGYAIHRYHGPGHLEKVYENALVHRLWKLRLDVKQQNPLTVYDEDGTVVGEYFADLVIEDCLIVELKAARMIAPEHTAQVLGYLRASRIEHGLPSKLFSFLENKLGLPGKSGHRSQMLLRVAVFQLNGRTTSMIPSDLCGVLKPAIRSSTANHHENHI